MKTRILPVILLALLTALGCRAVSPVSVSEKQPIDVKPIVLKTDEWRVTDHVVVITDASGTMYVNETFPNAKALTRSFVAAMPEATERSASSRGYSAGSIGFGGSERMKAQQAPFNRSSLANQAQSLEIMGSIDGMGGTTPLNDVIGEAQQALKGKQGRAALVIFSDGLPDDPPATLAAARRLVKSYPSNVCIHAVQTGTSQEGYAFLKQLTGLSGCGGVRNEDDLNSNYEVQQLARAVFVGPASLPPVAAAGPCQGIMRMGGIEFAFDSDSISEGSKPVLDVAVERLNECPAVRIQIGGHTDSSGAESYNNTLSYRRATATKNYFVSKGIPAARLEAEGFGESQPIAPNDTRDGRSRNRRVELEPAR